MMRSKLLGLILGGIVVLGAAGSLRAQGMMQGPQGGQQMMPMMQGPHAGERMMMHGMHGGMMEPGTHLLHLIKRARSTATGETADKLRQLEDRYYEKIVRQQAEVRVAKHRFFGLLQDPKASDRDLQKAHQTLMDKKAALAQTCFQGMLELRKILGAEAFANLFTMPAGMHPMMMRHGGMSSE